MTPEARAALDTILECLEEERYIVSPHFTERMDQRGLVWPDVLSVVESATDVRDDGLDRIGRPKWAVKGPASDDLEIAIVCVIDENESGDTTVLVTLYYQD